MCFPPIATSIVTPTQRPPSPQFWLRAQRADVKVLTLGREEVEKRYLLLQTFDYNVQVAHENPTNSPLWTFRKIYTFKKKLKHLITPA